MTIFDLMSGMVPATVALVSLSLIAFTAIMVGLSIYCVRMMNGPAVLFTTPHPSSHRRPVWTVEEWTFGDGTVRRVIRTETAS